jgi:hypothetical protein
MLREVEAAVLPLEASLHEHEAKHHPLEETEVDGENESEQCRVAQHKVDCKVKHQEEVPARVMRL